MTLGATPGDVGGPPRSLRQRLVLIVVGTTLGTCLVVNLAWLSVGLGEGHSSRAIAGALAQAAGLSLLVLLASMGLARVLGRQVTESIAGPREAVQQLERRAAEASRQMTTLSVENAWLRDALARARRSAEAKNAEVDAFVHSVSHDLQAPLVTLQGMGGLLLEDYAAALGDGGARYLRRLQANVERIERLVADLLALSRAGRDGRSPETVDLRELVEEVTVDMRGPLRTRPATIIVRDGATLWGDRVQLQQVVGHLLRNAVTYTADQVPPVVEIGAIDRGDVVECSVKDNGIGIDATYHATVFEIFQRLKEVDADGSGVGLAIVKKIVEAVGGHVSIESTRGSGSTFRFTWPAPPAVALRG